MPAITEFSSFGLPYCAITKCTGSITKEEFFSQFAFLIGRIIDSVDRYPKLFEESGLEKKAIPSEYLDNILINALPMYWDINSKDRMTRRRRKISLEPGARIKFHFIMDNFFLTIIFPSLKAALAAYSPLNVI